MLALLPAPPDRAPTTARNPCDPAKNSGGSSDGSAAAVADGLLPLAEGTDGGGSIRIPASWCGVYVYRASFGRIPFFAGPNACSRPDHAHGRRRRARRLRPARSVQPR
jgi:Asp-tRNA(Asn)/Glu-tRNA(Gln) amidotransferase A subunit family amidase